MTMSPNPVTSVPTTPTSSISYISRNFEEFDQIALNDDDDQVLKSEVIQPEGFKIRSLFGSCWPNWTVFKSNKGEYESPNYEDQKNGFLTSIWSKRTEKVLNSDKCFSMSDCLFITFSCIQY